MTNPFSRTTIGIVLGLAGASLIVTVVLTVLGTDPTSARSAGADSYSRSAIGHRGLVELLQRLDIPVVVSRDHSGDKARHGVLVLAEPHLDAGTEGSARLDATRTGARTVLLVLPKWSGFARPGQPWIDRVALLPDGDVNDVLRAAGAGASITRDGAGPWSSELPSPVIDRPQTFGDPGIDGFVGDGNHVLVGHVEASTPELWILADPEPFENAGLRHPENAHFAVALLDKLRDGGPVIFDETLHGHGRSPSLLRLLFQFPLVLVTIQLLACALLAVWAAAVRFGPTRAAPPPLAPGKDFLIRNTAALVRFGGHDSFALRRYLTSTVQAVRQQLHAPDSLRGPALIAWLEKIREQRKGTISIVALDAEIAGGPKTPQRIVELADQVYRWRMEMTHEPRNRT